MAKKAKKKKAKVLVLYPPALNRVGGFPPSEPMRYCGPEYQCIITRTLCADFIT